MPDQSLVVRFSLVKECGNCTLIEIIRTEEVHSITGLVSGEKARDRALAYSCLRHARLSASLVDGDGEQCLADEVELGERNFRQ